MRGSHTGEAIAKEVIQVLTAANIKHQLLAVTCDNAGNNGTLTRSLQKLLQEQGCEWRAQENTIPCLAHIINLVVQEIIAHLKLAASDAMENGQTLDQNHMAEIHTHMSVPNSLRKVRVVYHRGLSQPDTTGDTSNQHGDPAITPAIRAIHRNTTRRTGEGAPRPNTRCKNSMEFNVRHVRTGNTAAEVYRRMAKTRGCTKHHSTER